MIKKSVKAKNGHFWPFLEIFDLQTVFVRTETIFHENAKCYGIAIGMFYSVSFRDFNSSRIFGHKNGLKVKYVIDSKHTVVVNILSFLTVNFWLTLQYGFLPSRQLFVAAIAALDSQKNQFAKRHDEI